jgi:DUF4097 and DUF4098 domain-containing protein YvlB
VTNEKDKKFKVSDQDFTFAQTYKVSQPANLKISTSGGNITASGYEGDQIEVSFIVTKYGKVVETTLEELRQLAEIRIVNDGSNLEISVNNITQRNIAVGFRIRTPFKTASLLNTSGGNIEITGLTGNQKISTSGGNLNIRDIDGEVEANTSGGNITLDRIAGKCKVTTSGGNIDANFLKSDLFANTSGGNLNFSDIQGSLDASTSGGSISLSKIDGSIKANTSGGDIIANFDKLSKSLDLETSGGNINCTVPAGLGMDLNLSAESIKATLNNFSGKWADDKVQGKLNGGGIPINLTTFGGSINLEYK